jgi:hypothetical protein
VASKEELHAARLSGRRLLQLWNALPGVDKRKKIGDREALLDDLWSAIEALPEPDPEPQSDAKRPSKQQAVIAPAAAARGRNRRRSGERNGLAAPHGARPLLGNPEEEARTDPFLDHRGARPGLPHYRAGAGMSRAIPGYNGVPGGARAAPRARSRRASAALARSTKPMRRRISAASCCCVLSHTGCRKSFSAASARKGSASCANLHGSSTRPVRSAGALVSN